MKVDDLLTKRDLIDFETRLFSKLNETRNSKNLPKFLRSKDICEILGISPSTLQNFRIKGTIPYVKLQGTIFYDREEIETALLNNAYNSRENPRKS